MDSSLFLGFGYLGAGIGAGLCALAAGVGIGRLAAAALEGTARQPEAAGTLRVTMIIPAALIEGIGFFGLVICLMLALKAPTAPVNVEAPAAASSAAH